MKKILLHIILLILLLPAASFATGDLEAVEDDTGIPGDGGEGTGTGTAGTGTTGTATPTSSQEASWINYYDLNVGEIIDFSPKEDAEGNEITTFSSLCTTAIKPNKLTGNVIRCAERIIDEGADRLINNYMKLFSSMIFYVIILAVMFHGMKMMFGVAKEHGYTLMMTMKVLLVLFVCSPNGYLYMHNARTTLLNFPKDISASILSMPPGEMSTFLDWVDYFGDGAVTQVFDFLTWDDEYWKFNDFMLSKTNHGDDDGDGIENGVDDDDDGDGNPDPTKRMSDVYDKLDELIIRLFGVAKVDAESDEQKTELFIGMAALVAGLLFTGPIGISVAMIAIIYTTAIFFAIAEIALFFLVIMIAINFLIAIAPLALACMLFEQTKRITKLWFSYLLIYSIQPIVLSAFLAFVIMVIAQVANQMEAPYKKIQEKWQNSDNQPDMKTKLFDCMGMSGSNDLVKSQISNDDQWNRLTETANEQQFYNNRFTSGKLNPADYADRTKQDCDIKVFTLKLDDDVAPVVDGETMSQLTKFTKVNLTELLGLKIAMIVLFVMLISFMRELPKMVNSLVGTNPVPGAGYMPSEASVSQVSTVLSDKILGTNGSQGLIEKLGGKLSNSVKRF